MANFLVVLFTIMSCVAIDGGEGGLGAGIEGAETRSRGKRAAGECKGGSGQYVTYVNPDMSNSHLANSVEDCFRSLKTVAEKQNSNNIKWGCYHASTAAGCRCTYDSNYIYSLAQTFSEALENLQGATSNFGSIEAERHEGNMYLTYTCPKSASTYPQVISDGRNCAGRGNAAESLSFRAGDVIFCKINVFAYHVMLATSDSTVAQVEGGGLDVFTAELREDRWTHVICSFDDCHVNPGDTFCSSRYNPHGMTHVDKCKYSTEESVQRARKDIKERGSVSVYYNVFRCNCEHWVSLWRTGSAFSRQAFPTGIFGGTNDECPI